MKALHILHVSTPISWRGGEQQVAYLIKGLQQLGGVTQYVICTSGGAMEHYCKEQHIVYHSLPKGAAWNPLLAVQVKKYCEKWAIDMIHTHDAHAHTRAILATTLLHNTPPIIVARRVDFAPKQSGFTRYKYLHQQVVRIICVSDAIKKVMQQYTGEKYEKRVLTVHSGVDIDKFKVKPDGRLRKACGIAEDIPLIGIVAALAPHKDHLTFLQTASHLLQKGLQAHFIIIGEGSERSKIESFIKEQQLEHAISLTGFRSDIPQILPELDLFLMTSEKEGLGTSVLDAFAAGVPVIATNAGGIGEMVINRKTGMLVAIKDVEGLADAVEEVLNKEELRVALVEQARKRVEAFSYHEMARKTKAVYETIHTDEQ